MAKRLKTLELPAERDLVVMTRRYGKEVAVSPVADKGRKEGCLCIHTDSKGKTVMCERLKNNFLFQKECEARTKQDPDKGKAFQDEIALMTFKRMMQTRKVFEGLPSYAPCPLALILFELAKMAPAALPISACAGYLPPKEQAVLHEIKVGASEKIAPFISKEDAQKLNRDMKTLLESDAVEQVKIAKKKKRVK